MTRPLVALDLDDTLLQNRAMIHGIWQVVAQNFAEKQIDPSVAYDNLHDFYRQTAPGMKAYDFDAHLESYGIEVAAAYRAVKISALADGRYEVAGVASFLANLRQFADVLVLTYGFDGYQRLKASLCPSLTDVDIITTLDAKSNSLTSLSDVRYMVDDRLVPDLPDGVQFVMVSLVGKPVDPEAPQPVFTSLKNVGEFLYEQLH